MKISAREQRKSALQSRLETWDNAASQAVTRTGRKSLNWLVYTTAVGSALAMATDAGAQIVSYGGTPPAATLTAPPGGTGTAHILSVKGDVFNLAAADFTSLGIVGLEAFGKVGMLVNLSSGVQKLSSKAVISSKAGRFGSSFHRVKLVNGSYQLGSFNASQPRFAGIEFDTGARPSSSSVNNPVKIHYGWIEVEFSGSPDPNSITAINWAYNSVAGQAIAAGETSAPVSTTPEPGTAALSLLAMGAAGVLAWRRKKAALNTV
jgi:PEP-CTERM motif